MFVHECGCLCACLCVCLCVCLRLHVCVHVCTSVKFHLCKTREALSQNVIDTKPHTDLQHLAHTVSTRMTLDAVKNACRQVHTHTHTPPTHTHTISLSLSHTHTHTHTPHINRHTHTTHTHNTHTHTHTHTLTHIMNVNERPFRECYITFYYMAEESVRQFTYHCRD